MKKFRNRLTHATIGFCLLLACQHTTKAQGCNNSKVLNTKVFNIATLENKWEQYAKDKGFATLLEDVKKQGFIRLAKNEKTAWGFNADFIADSSLGTAEQEAEVCSFDFYRKTEKGIQMCTMVWRKVGVAIYKAYMVFPVGETNFLKAMEKSEEFFVDEDNKIQEAHSFGKCWARCMFKRFSYLNCTGAIAACGTAAAGLTALGIGVTAPIALGIFGACAGVFCLSPLAICAAYCL